MYTFSQSLLDEKTHCGTLSNVEGLFFKDSMAGYALLSHGYKSAPKCTRRSPWRSSLWPRTHTKRDQKRRSIPTTAVSSTDFQLVPHWPEALIGVIPITLWPNNYLCFFSANISLSFPKKEGLRCFQCYLAKSWEWRKPHFPSWAYRLCFIKYCSHLPFLIEKIAHFSKWFEIGHYLGLYLIS